MVHYFELKNPLEDLISRLHEDWMCYDLLDKIRFPLGFICPKCSCLKGYKLDYGRMYQCKGCRYQCSLTAGTVFHGSKVPLSKWFAATFYFVNNQGGLSATALKKLIFVSYKTALRMLRKIRKVMADANEKRFIEALFYKIKHLLHSKGIPIAKAAIYVQLEPNGVKKVQFTDPRFAEIRKDQPDVKSVVTDKSEESAISSFVGSALAQLSRFMLGTYHHYCPKYFALYVAEFVYRFNEPDPLTMVMKLLCDCIGVPFDPQLAVIREW